MMVVVVVVAMEEVVAMEVVVWRWFGGGGGFADFANGRDHNGGKDANGRNGREKLDQCEGTPGMRRFI
jgi:hypothetical protein